MATQSLTQTHPQASVFVHVPVMETDTTLGRYEMVDTSLEPGTIEDERQL